MLRKDNVRKLRLKWKCESWPEITSASLESFHMHAFYDPSFSSILVQPWKILLEDYNDINRIKMSSWIKNSKLYLKSLFRDGKALQNSHCLENRRHVQNLTDQEEGKKVLIPKQWMDETDSKLTHISISVYYTV